jgi:hypothetical protein
MKDIRIPGNRNFLVTYDGSLWAMNATIVGNIIGSNIMGGSVIGSELHIGYDANNTSPRVYSEMLSGDSWETHTAPTQNTGYADNTNKDGAFYVKNNGDVVANHLTMYGGEINVGGFHVYDAKAAVADGMSGIVNFGETDLVGPVHIYGNLGIGIPVNPAVIGSSGNFY